MPDLSNYELEELASLAPALVASRAWQLLIQLFEFKAEQQTRVEMSKPESSPFNKGRVTGFNEVMNKPNDLIRDYSKLKTE